MLTNKLKRILESNVGIASERARTCGSVEEIHEIAKVAGGKCVSDVRVERSYDPEEGISRIVVSVRLHWYGVFVLAKRRSQKRLIQLFKDKLPIGVEFAVAIQYPWERILR